MKTGPLTFVAIVWVTDAEAEGPGRFSPGAGELEEPQGTCWKASAERAGQGRRTDLSDAGSSLWLERPRPSSPPLLAFKELHAHGGGSGRSGVARTPSPPSASRRPESFPLICPGHADRCARADGHWTPAARAPRVFPFRANRTAAVSQTWYPASDATLPVLLVRRGQTFARFVQLRSHTLQRYDVRDGLEASYQSKQPLTIRSAITPVSTYPKEADTVSTQKPAHAVPSCDTHHRQNLEATETSFSGQWTRQPWSIQTVECRPAPNGGEPSSREKTRGNFNACD